MRVKLMALLVAGAATLFAAPAAAAAPATPANFEVMLVVDTSGSTAGHPVEYVRAASSSFVSHMPAGVRIGLESFGRRVKVLSAPTPNRAFVTHQVAGLTAGGRTPLHDAVITATRSFTPAAKYKAIVLISDGGDEGSVASLDAAVAAVRGVHVEVVSLTTPKTDLSALRRLGTVTSADDPNALRAVLARLEAELIPATVKQAQAAAGTATGKSTSSLPTGESAKAGRTTSHGPVEVLQHAVPTVHLPSRAGIWIGAGLVVVALSGFVLLTFFARD